MRTEYDKGKLYSLYLHRCCAIIVLLLWFAIDKDEEEEEEGDDEEESKDDDDDDEDVGESSRPSSSQQQQQHQHHSSTAMTSNQNAGLDDGDSGLLGRPLLLLCLPMREIRVPSLRRGIPRPPSQHR